MEEREREGGIYGMVCGKKESDEGGIEERKIVSFSVRETRERERDCYPFSSDRNERMKQLLLRR